MKMPNQMKFAFVYFLCFSNICFAKNSDQVRNPLLNKYEEAGKQLYAKGEFDSAIVIIKKGIELSINLKDQDNQANFLQFLATCYYQKGQNDSALALSFKALEIHQKINNEQKITYDMFCVGSLYNSLGNFSSGLEYLFNALKKYEKGQDNIGHGRCLGEIAYVYDRMLKHEECIKYNMQALDLYKKAANTIRYQIACYTNAGSSYSQLRLFNKALEYYQKSLALSKENSEDNISTLYNNIAITYSELNRSSESIEYYNKALNNAGKYNMLEEQIWSLNGLGHEYSKLKKFSKAEMYFKNALQIINNTDMVNDVLAEINEGLSNVYMSLGNYKEALNYFKQYHNIYDTLLNESNIETLTRNEMQYKFDKQEQQRTAAQEKIYLENKADMEKQSKIIYMLFAATLLFIGLSLIVYLLYRQDKLSSQHRELTIENQLTKCYIA